MGLSWAGLSLGDLVCALSSFSFLIISRSAFWMNPYLGLCIYVYVDVTRCEDRIFEGGVTRMYPGNGTAVMCEAGVAGGFAKEFSSPPWWPGPWPHPEFPFSERDHETVV